MENLSAAGAGPARQRGDSTNRASGAGPGPPRLLDEPSCFPLCVWSKTPALRTPGLTRLHVGVEDRPVLQLARVPAVHGVSLLREVGFVALLQHGLGVLRRPLGSRPQGQGCSRAPARPPPPPWHPPRPGPPRASPLAPWSPPPCPASTAPPPAPRPPCPESAAGGGGVRAPNGPTRPGTAPVQPHMAPHSPSPAPGPTCVWKSCV